MLRSGTGEPLVLLHGVTGSERMWRDVIPTLAERNDVIVPTALGHNGGRPMTKRPARFSHVVDDAERLLDELGIERAHLAGNSMGGWVALELARRGRALSVCAISPAGMWIPGKASIRRPTRILRRNRTAARIFRRLLPLVIGAAPIRRIAFRDVAMHAERLTTEQAIDLADDVIACEAASDLLHTDECFPKLDPAPCPVTIAWCEHDRLFPEQEFGRRARERVPAARYTVLPRVGHVPMIDDPGLVATAIIEAKPSPSVAA